jgi:hypothetical protein
LPLSFSNVINSKIWLSTSIDLEIESTTSSSSGVFLSITITIHNPLSRTNSLKGRCRIKVTRLQDQ